MNKVKKLFVALLLMLVALGTNVAMAQQMPPIPVDEAVRIGKLDCGLTYYIRHNNYPENRVNFYIAQRVGSIQEEESQRGLAHFLEHMAFNGSEHFNGEGKSIIDYTRSLGVEFGRDMNAYTSIAETVYNINNVPSTRQSAIDSCLLILKDWSGGLLLTDEEIDKERGVIHEEWRLSRGAQMRMLENNLETLYPGSKYGKRMPIGLMSVVDNFPYQELRDYYHKWYRPDNQALVIVGDVDVDHIEAQIKELFKNCKLDPNAAQVVDEPVPDNETAIIVVDKDKEQQASSTQIIFKHDAVAKEGKTTLDYLLYNYMRNMMSSMLNSRLSEKLQAVVDDAASTEGEKAAARNQLQRLTPEIVEGKFMEKIEREITKREQQRKSLRVRELSFNSYYEFARQRIPQIIREDSIEFPINDFAAILKPFYRGGALEYTLNNDMDGSLFDEQFIVFEIDKVKDDPVLFPIIVLIIMDVFTQKMRIKNKVRKCLVIEEAWKAIATPVMAEYIKYLYKTARKHWAMVGVVTQEIQDITSSPIVKEAIINNSDVFMLLDQSKFKDKFDDIKATLALTDIDCKKIFTINRLDNKLGRSPFKEVFIKRGTEGDVFGIEEPRECYMSYTTEKAEKEALKLYRRELDCTHQQAIEAFVRDWERSGIGKSLEFAQLVNKQGRVLNLPPKKQVAHA